MVSLRLFGNEVLVLYARLYVAHPLANEMKLKDTLYLVEITPKIICQGI